MAGRKGSPRPRSSGSKHENKSRSTTLVPLRPRRSAEQESNEFESSVAIGEVTFVMRHRRGLAAAAGSMALAAALSLTVFLLESRPGRAWGLSQDVTATASEPVSYSTSPRTMTATPAPSPTGPDPTSTSTTPPVGPPSETTPPSSHAHAPPKPLEVLLDPNTKVGPSESIRIAVRNPAHLERAVCVVTDISKDPPPRRFGFYRAVKEGEGTARCPDVRFESTNAGRTFRVEVVVLRREEEGLLPGLVEAVFSEVLPLGKFELISEPKEVIRR
jgi:hypothetical protein